MTTPIPRTLENPPRSTGRPELDFPILVDYIYKAYQVIVQAVNYINAQVQENPNLNVNDLPDPTNTTLAQAQTTANLAYALADQADGKADILDPRVDTAETDIDNLQARVNGFITDTFTVTDGFTGATVTFGTAQVDDQYTIHLQPKSFTSTPAQGAFIISSKTYNATDFSVTLYQAPGVGTSVTYEWRLIRNT